MTLAVSPRLVQELMRRGHPPDRLECSLPGIDIPQTRADPHALRRKLGLVGAQVLCYCGNLDGYQDWTRLVDIMKVLSPEHPSLRLLVITSSESTPIERAMRLRGLEDKLVILPHGTFDVVLEQLTVADICLVPRNTPGGIPIKLLAYFAMGKPVVSSRSGTAGIDFGDALKVVPDGDTDALARAVVSLLEDPDDGRRRGALGERLVRRDYSWDHRCRQLEEQLYRIIDAPGETSSAPAR